MIANPPMLEGRSALLTGAGTGLGRGIGLSIAEAGGRVALLARSTQATAETVRRIRDLGGEAIALQGDVTDAASVRSAVDAVVRAFGGLDIVVQIASPSGTNQAGNILDAEAELWDAHFAVNLDSVFHLAQAALPHLRRGGQGRFVTVNSAYGLSGDASNFLYAGQKGALRGFTKALAREWGREGVTVNGFAPSAESETAKEYLDSKPELRALFESMIPVGRMGDPHLDVGRAVAALVSDHFRYVTGQTLPIDGGFYTAL